MNARTTLAAGALAASMAGGAVFGALVFTPGVSSAEDTPAVDVLVEEGEGGSDGACVRRVRPALAAAAEAIGIEVSELRAALRDGQTMAEVAEDNGVAAEDLVDTLVADAIEHLDQAVADGKLTEDEAAERKADLEERITELVERDGLPPRPGHGRHPNTDTDTEPEVDGAVATA